MTRTYLTTAASVILCISANAQSATDSLRKIGATKSAGIYHVATGTWTRNVATTANLGPDVIYTNTAASTYFTTLDLENATGDVQIVDEGRIPVSGGNCVLADRTSYEVNCISFTYCTEVSTPTIGVTFTMYSSYSPCDLPSLGNATTIEAGTASGTGLPGGGAGPGTFACWAVTFDLTGAEFCLEGDGGPFAPGFDNSAALDSFGVSWAFPGQFGQATGPVIAGDPTWTEADPCSITGIGGSGTYYYTGPPSCGDTGLDTADFYAIDGMTALPGGPGCYFFGGYKNTNGCGGPTNTPFGSFDLTIFASESECMTDDCEPFCDPANVNSSGNAAELAAIPIPGVGAGFRLECSGGPNNFGSAFGFFLVSDGNTANVPLGEGNLCLNGPQGRYNPAAGGVRNSLGQFDSNGDFINLALTTTSTMDFGFDIPVELPSPPGGDILAGSKWYFQLWFRDTSPAGSTVNLSNGLGITF